MWRAKACVAFDEVCFKNAGFGIIDFLRVANHRLLECDFNFFVGRKVDATRGAGFLGLLAFAQSGTAGELCRNGKNEADEQSAQKNGPLPKERSRDQSLISIRG